MVRTASHKIDIIFVLNIASSVNILDNYFRNQKLANKSSDATAYGDFKWNKEYDNNQRYNRGLNGVVCRAGPRKFSEGGVSSYVPSKFLTKKPYQKFEPNKPWWESGIK